MVTTLAPLAGLRMHSDSAGLRHYRTPPPLVATEAHRCSGGREPSHRSHSRRHRASLPTSTLTVHARNVMIPISTLTSSDSATRADRGMIDVRSVNSSDLGQLAR